MVIPTIAWLIFSLQILALTLSLSSNQLWYGRANIAWLVFSLQILASMQALKLSLVLATTDGIWSTCHWWSRNKSQQFFQITVGLILILLNSIKTSFLTHWNYFCLRSLVWVRGCYRLHACPQKITWVAKIQSKVRIPPFKQSLGTIAILKTVDVHRILSDYGITHESIQLYIYLAI